MSANTATINDWTIVRVRSFDKKSEMRIIEHGDEWLVEKGPIEGTYYGIVGKFLLLVPMKSKGKAMPYMRWWPMEYCTLI